MRYTVQFQKPTGHWVVLDTQNFMMLGSFRSEEDASIAARRFEESAGRARSEAASRSVA
jgi:hypothetical protein